MAWTHSIVGKENYGDRIRVLVDFVNGTETIHESFTTSSPLLGLDWLKAQIAQKIEQLTVLEEFANTLPTGTLDLTPPEQPEPPATPIPIVSTEPSNCYQMQADAVSKVCAKGTTTTVDYEMVNRDGESYTIKYLNGAEVTAVDAVNGDWAECSIVDVNNVLGYGENVTLKTYVIKKFLFPGYVHTIPAMAPGAIPVGCVMRTVYHSVGTVKDPTIYINFDVEVRD